MRVFLTGHGGWLPQNGYFSVPAKTRVVFYTENAKLMLASDVHLIVGGKYPHDPDQVVEEFKTCQNMTLYPDDASEINPTLSALIGNPDRDHCDIVRVTQPTQLSKIVLDYPGHEFVWTCCRDLSLASTPGNDTRARDMGLNAVQTGGRVLNYDKKKDEIVLNPKWRIRISRAWAF
ncbi:MAG TPA: hypothetical protein VMH39_01855 [Gemmatimonadaceae bacterium]|nr:hypothetical protein [Gemmatimonadaceae bacterium]